MACIYCVAECYFRLVNPEATTYRNSRGKAHDELPFLLASTCWPLLSRERVNLQQSASKSSEQYTQVKSHTDCGLLVLGQR